MELLGDSGTAGHMLSEGTECTPSPPPHHSDDDEEEEDLDAELGIGTDDDPDGETDDEYYAEPVHVLPVAELAAAGVETDDGGAPQQADGTAVLSRGGDLSPTPSGRTAEELIAAVVAAKDVSIFAISCVGRAS
jgi:hypothetical protein